METLFQDIRHAVRMLLKRPGYTAVIVLTLALGIGANTAIFSVVNGIVFQPLPFPSSNRLVAVMESNPRAFSEPIGASFPDFKDWEKENQVFQQIAGYTGQSLALVGVGEPVRVKGQSVSASFFPMLEAEPLLGRVFVADDEKPGENKVVLLSHGFWQRQFGGDQGIIGRTVRLDGVSYTVLGVMKPGFKFLREVDVWTTLSVPPVLQKMRGARFMQVIGKLKPDATLEQARGAMTSIGQQLESEHPETNSGWGVSLIPLQQKIVGNVKRGLLLLFAAVGLVLLVACANVANLLLTRGTARQKEMAIRIALGATRWRLVRHLLTESAVLALVGGAIGLLLSLWGIEALRSLSPPNLPRLDEIGIDRTVLAFAFLVSLLTGLLFGLAPARHSSKLDLQDALKDASGFKSRGGRLMRGSLVVSEIALSLVLLIGAGLLSRSFLTMLSVDRGFRSDHVLTMEISLPRYKYAEDHQQLTFFQQLLERVNSLEGVQSAALTTVLPLSSNNSRNTFGLEGQQADSEWANMRLITGSYFEAMSIPVVRGRTFNERDAKGSPDVVIINELMANRYWPNQDPIGKRLMFGDGGSSIVGVVGNIKHSGLDTELEPEMYTPLSQQPTGSMVLVARAESEPISLVSSFRDIVTSLDKEQPVENFRTMDDVVSRSVAQPRFVVLVLGVFAVLALTLAAVGIYGVVSFNVTQRSRELGIRMALGARPSRILQMVLGEGLLFAIIGVGIGLLGSLAVTPVISEMLFRVSATDPLTFAALSLFLIGVALGATFIPARRATRVDPMIALRHE